MNELIVIVFTKHNGVFEGKSVRNFHFDLNGAVELRKHLNVDLDSASCAAKNLVKSDSVKVQRAEESEFSCLTFDCKVHDPLKLVVLELREVGKGWNEGEAMGVGALVAALVVLAVYLV